ncbi:hypothetical protein GMORB2_6148 [Geosmithia morbida]|uniref:BZIP domain-containing protein n=1 Tax=Geosmithia morbida TaxID=1094350 RepID=A0A9P4YVT2_9HYPO|nr:uncharacterized protein GMORB2_6148 [Geosmithia morbida]KAF4123447.1 hypothetical protein GMORB2_6148 [Geosmithia morbida]
MTSTNKDDHEDPATKSRQQNQARRAQVRSAQIRHRQRKADHQRQLELDMTEYQSLIAQIEGETAVLRRQNAAMRAQLDAAGISVAAHEWSGSVDSSDASASGDEYYSVSDDGAGAYPELFPSVDMDRLTVTLAVDDTMGSPALQISGRGSGSSNSSSSSSSSSSSGSSSASYSHRTGTSSAATSPPTTTTSTTLTTYLNPVQEEAAVNFILALEHVCWSHFMLGDFPHHHDGDDPHHDDVQIKPDTVGHDADSRAPHDDDYGHALMASTYCMGNAPSPVFDYTMEALFNNIDFNPTPTPSSPPAMEWQSPSSSMTLANLFGLASSLNPGDEDLTPVQAWFELADRYNPAALIDSGILESLKRELRGVVHCLYYGAVMERVAFENVLSRVMKGFDACSL